MAWHTTWNEPPRRRSGWLVDRGGFFPPGVKIVLIVTVGVFLLDFWTKGRLSEWGSLSVDGLMRREVWRLLTYMFLHSLRGLDHILWNMFIFVMLGRTLERQIGGRQFLALYLLSGVVGGLCETGFNLAMHLMHGPILTRAGVAYFTEIPAVGASAGVAGVLVAFAVLNPRAIFLVFFLLPIQARWLALVYVLIETRHMLLGLKYGWVDGVAHAAHFGGCVVGFVWMKWGWRLAAALKRRPAPDRPAALDRDAAWERAELDRILQKVHDEGVDSLSLREKMFLQEIGDKYRDRF